MREWGAAVSRFRKLPIQSLPSGSERFPQPFACLHSSAAVSVENRRFRSSYERGCQEKILLRPPRGDTRLVACIQPCLLTRGAFGFTALDRRVFQRRCQTQLISLT